MNREDIRDARRHLGAIRTLAACNQLDPISLRTLTGRLEGFIDEMAMWLEENDPEPMGRTPIRYVGKFAVIDGDGPRHPAPSGGDAA